MKEITLTVEGMSCEHCEKRVEQKTGALSGVTKVKADHNANRVVVSFDEKKTDEAAVREVISSCGYNVK